MRPELRGDHGRISTCPLVGLLLLSQLRLPLPLAQTSTVGLLGSHHTQGQVLPTLVAQLQGLPHSQGSPLGKAWSRAMTLP